MARTRSGAEQLGISERFLLLLISAVQCVNVLDFMIVMPLGPDFARDLGIPISRLGIIGGSYTASAAVAGALGSKYLDRFDRRRALACALFGLVVATALAGFAYDLWTLIAARLLAGIFGGPASSIALAIIADVVPSKRRGRALGMVMSGFAVASVFGVPISLELARHLGWRAPFFAVAALGFVVTVWAILQLPPIRIHMSAPGQRSRIWVFLRDPNVLFTLAGTFTVMVSSFCIVPNLSAYLQHNLGYPRNQLSALYLAGGSISFVVTRVVGSYVDRLGATRVATAGSLIFALILGGTFVLELPQLPAMLIFATFSVSTAVRNVALNTLSSRVPFPHERARFMSLQSAMQHLAAAFGASLGSALLVERADGQLGGMPLVASIAIVFGLCLPLLLIRVERLLAMRRPSLPEAWLVEAEVARSSIPPM